MLTIAIVGNYNVGKTSLFNLLTNTNFSFTNKFKYFTLDYNYGFLDKKYKIINKNIIFIDTNSILNFIFLNKKNKGYNNFLLNLERKFLFIIKKVNFIFFLVDSHIITEKDKSLSKYLIKYNNNIVLLLTKKDIYNNFILNLNNFYCLRINNIFYISIYDKNSIFIFLNEFLNKKKILNKKKNFYIRNIKFCINLDKNYYILKKFIFNKKISNYEINKNIIKLVILGKNGIGKSSFLNLVCKNNRSFISNKTDGCTKDFIMSLYKYNKNIYYLISDSPGLCNNKNYYNDIILKIKFNFNIILYIIDFNLNISRYDLKMLNFFLKEGKYILLLFNKCDNIKNNILLKYKDILIKRYDFMKYIDIYFFSCLNYNINIINNLFKTIYLNYLNIFNNNINNIIINNILKIFNKNIKNIRNNKNYIFKLRYALICKYYPLIIIIYGNKINLINNFYKKKILNLYMKKLKFKGFRIFLRFKEIYNPYKKKK